MLITQRSSVQLRPATTDGKAWAQPQALDYFGPLAATWRDCTVILLMTDEVKDRLLKRSMTAF